MGVHVYGHGWHCYILEHGIASLAVSRINKPVGDPTHFICRERRKLSLTACVVPIAAGLSKFVKQLLR